MKCRCTQKLIECAPSDDFVTVLACDNRGSDTTVTCSYSETVGTSYTTEATQSQEVSLTVEETIQAGLGDIFSTSLGYSATTGYDWSTTSAETYDFAVTRTVEADVPPGVLVRSV